ncbi:MAG: hypothetical protein ACLFP4_02000 [Spirochaetales bacterium]
MRPVHPNIDLHPEDQQLMRLERHSYINLINVVHAELQLIERMIEAPGRLRESVRLAEYASHAFRDREVAQEHCEAFAVFDEEIGRAVSCAVAEGGALGESDDVREAVGILESVLADAQCRLHEVLARHGVERSRQSFSAESVEHGIRLSFDGRISMAGARDETRLPIGLPGTLGRLLRSLARSSGNPDEHNTGEYTLEVDAVGARVEGPGQIEAFLPLASGMRPSQVHERIRAGETHLRGLLEFFYYSVPDGSCRLTLDGSFLSAECHFAATK